MQKGLLEFSSLLRGKTIALFCDNVTTIAYLGRSGGTRSQVLFLEAREILLWVESMEITLLPQFFQGSSPPVAGDHRPIRDLANSEAPSVLCSSVGTQGSGSRCIPPALGQPPGICLPSHSHHQESSSRTESLSQLRSHFDRLLLASKRLVFQVGAVKIFLTHYLVLSPGLLYVDTVVLGLLLCLYIHTCNVL